MFFGFGSRAPVSHFFDTAFLSRRQARGFLAARPFEPDGAVRSSTRFPLFETQEFSGITRGPAAAAGGGNRPTIGLLDFGSVARVRGAVRAATWRTGNLERWEAEYAREADPYSVIEWPLLYEISSGCPQAACRSVAR